MTVKELIKVLDKLPQDTSISVVYDKYYGWDGTEEVEKDLDPDMIQEDHYGNYFFRI